MADFRMFQRAHDGADIFVNIDLVTLVTPSDAGQGSVLFFAGSPDDKIEVRQSPGTVTANGP